MKKSKKKERGLFVLKRAFRFGEVLRNDVMEAFEWELKSESVATQILNDAVVEYANYIFRDGNKIKPKCKSVPKIISDIDLLTSIDQANLFYNTGLRAEELPTTSTATMNSLPLQEDAFTFICQSIAAKRTINIHYVGLKKDDHGSTRTLYPIGIEKKSEQWRLVAHDLAAEDYRIKYFLFSRIMWAEKSDKRKPRKLGSIGPKVQCTDYKAKLNKNYTEEQKKVLENQLRIKNERVKLNSRYIHEYRIDFLGKDVNDGIVWPILEVLQ